MYRIIFIIVMLFIITEPSSIASESLTSRMTDCASISRDLKRLSCYDNIPQKTISNHTNIEQQGALNHEPISSTGKTGAASISGNSSKPAATIIDNFGLKTQADKINTIHSSIVGEFSGWKIKDKITLANGQVWKITGGTKMYYKATNPEITITKGILDSYRIKINGLNKSARVLRVK
ncbi:MAG: hypothetical protein ACI9N9_001283 [Enterobacterales bacterium]|jgi:hypothetical protein